MKLKDELAACECAIDPLDFKELLVHTLVNSFPDTTIDRLVCNPLMALKYCIAIRKLVKEKLLHDGVILKTLMNIRKQKNCPTGLRSKRGGIRLEKQLAELEFSESADSFRETVVDCFADMYKSRTIDDITYYPMQSRAYCSYVRNKTGFQGFDDLIILKTLMNSRKAP